MNIYDELTLNANLILLKTQIEAIKHTLTKEQANLYNEHILASIQELSNHLSDNEVNAEMISLLKKSLL